MKDNYLKEHKEYALENYYIDVRYSGTNFNRLEFQKMLEDIKNKKINIDKENWIVTENHHEAIINNAKFDKVQDILNNYAIRTNRNGNIEILSGFIRCNDCKGQMILKGGKNTQ